MLGLAKCVMSRALFVNNSISVLIVQWTTLIINCITSSISNAKLTAVKDITLIRPTQISFSAEVAPAIA